MDGRWVVTFHLIYVVAVALEQRPEFGAGNPGQHGRIRDLVPVEVEDRQHRPIASRIEELVRVPAGGERPGLCLTVADDAAGQEVGVVECGAVRVSQGVPQFATLVDRPWGLRGDVAGNPPGERELAEQPSHPVEIPGDVGVDLRVRPLEVGVGHQARTTVTRAGDVDRVQVPISDYPIHVRVDQV